MYQNERLESITEILRQYGYVTVKYLSAALHYSRATINRDLNLLEGRGVLKRTYGGVEITENAAAIPLPFRYHLSKTEKLHICKKAAELVRDGDVVFIDAGTTTEGLRQFLTAKKELTVITNNISLAARLSEEKVRTIVLGGTIVEPPAMIWSAETIDAALLYRADKLFFSSSCATKDGKVYFRGNIELLLMKNMMKQAKQTYFLIDGDKLTDEIEGGIYYLCDFSAFTGVISDYSFSQETKKAFPNTTFIEV